MISVNVDTAIFLYLMFSLCSIFALWVFFERSKSFDRYSIEDKVIWSCEICTYTYVDPTHDTISRCPRCQSLNEKSSLNQA